MIARYLKRRPESAPGNALRGLPLKGDELGDDGVHRDGAYAASGGQAVVAVDHVLGVVEAVQVDQRQGIAALHGALDTAQALVVLAASGAAVRTKVAAQLVGTTYAADDVCDVDCFGPRDALRERTRRAGSLGERARAVSAGAPKSLQESKQG